MHYIASRKPYLISLDLTEKEKNQKPVSISGRYKSRTGSTRIAHLGSTRKKMIRPREITLALIFKLT